MIEVTTQAATAQKIVCASSRASDAGHERDRDVVERADPAHAEPAEEGTLAERQARAEEAEEDGGGPDDKQEERHEGGASPAGLGPARRP